MVKDSSNASNIVPCKINHASKVPVSMQIWKSLQRTMSEDVDVMTPFLDTFGFDPDYMLLCLKKCKSREKLLDDHIGDSQLKFDLSLYSNENETDSVSSAKEEE